MKRKEGVEKDGSGLIENRASSASGKGRYLGKNVRGSFPAQLYQVTILIYVGVDRGSDGTARKTYGDYWEEEGESKEEQWSERNPGHDEVDESK